MEREGGGSVSIARMGKVCLARSRNWLFPLCVCVCEKGVRILLLKVTKGTLGKWGAAALNKKRTTAAD